MADLAQEEKQQRAADEGTGATTNLGCAKNLICPVFPVA
jgi:hypothetical protein